MTLTMTDLFCGAGGSSTGAVQVYVLLGNRRGCGAGATAYGALVDADDLTREAAGHASAVGVAECPVVPGTHWCGGCDDLRRDAAAEAVPF